MRQVSFRRTTGDGLLEELRQRSDRAKNVAQGKEDEKASGPSFQDHLVKGIKETNQLQEKAESMATDLVTGKSQNIHETMLASTHAELSFNLMVQVRNKALEAYQEVMRMPI